MYVMHIPGMKLSDWLKANGKSAAWLASQVGRDPSFITRVKNGDAMPSIAVAAEIQRITNGAVTAVDFVPATAAITSCAAEAGAAA
ncbi:helix-turn-helix transcriptional regulator [Methylobacterium sp. WSM2598]|uniref:helix-turn-helix transcriptional regulator n=1 Tax=Methylobacterium sp. WSM2598 TaxID=398261 RepID=UPI0003708616|nr:helix-turn-helix transcriptional regulator [Methylobacterium sp. WSM2598]